MAENRIDGWLRAAIWIILTTDIPILRSRQQKLPDLPSKSSNPMRGGGGGMSAPPLCWRPSGELKRRMRLLRSLRLRYVSEEKPGIKFCLNIANFIDVEFEEHLTKHAALLSPFSTHGVDLAL